MIEFSAELQNAEISSVTLLDSDSIADSLTGIICGVAGFQCSYIWKIGQLESLQNNSTEDEVFLEFSTTLKPEVYANIP